MNEESSHNSLEAADPWLNKNPPQRQGSLHNYSQHSKATTLIKRRALNIDEDDDMSQSSTVRLDKQEEIKGHYRESKHSHDKNSTIDMQFISEINNEANFLITKFQQDQYVMQRMKNDQNGRTGGGLVNNRKATDISRENVDSTSTYMVHPDKSIKTIGHTGQKTQQSVPLTSKGNQSHVLNHKDVMSDSQHAQTVVNQYGSSAVYSHQSLRGRQTAQYATSTYEDQSQFAIEKNEYHESQPNVLDQSSLFFKADPKIVEDGSHIQISQYLDSSKYNITDRPETTLQKHSDTILNSQRDMMSFRQPKIISIEHDQEALLHEEEGTAQFDLQNFNAFNGRLESLASSSAFPNQSKEESQRTKHLFIEEQPYQNRQEQIQSLVSVNQHSNRYMGNETEQYDDQDGYDEDEGQDDEYDQELEEEEKQYKAQGGNQYQRPLPLSNLSDDEEPVQYNPMSKFKSSSPPPFDPSVLKLQNQQNNKPKVPVLSPPPLDKLNDDIVYNRLPQGFFAKKDEETKDLDSVLSSIKQMRQDFFGYVQENNINEKLDEISNILQPELFINKHFGQEAELMFEKVLSPQQKQRAQSRSPQLDITMDEHKHDGQDSAIIEEDNESSPEKSYSQAVPQSRKQTQRSKRQKSNQASARSIPSKKVQPRHPDASDYSNNGPRVMKMADYFKEPVKSPLSQSVDGHHQQFMSVADDQISLNEEEKDNLKVKMEQDILSKIDINFLFNKGETLRFGLIDQTKAYKIMLKIKEVASHQVERGQREIDYNEIVRFLKEEELYGSQPNQQSEIEMHPNAMPAKFKAPPHQGPISPDQWAQVVDFMRKNPRLLMQMLPDNSDDETTKDTEGNSRDNRMKSKHLQQIEDAKKWTKLQALSKNFLQKRDLLDAIDKEQQQRLASPPSNAQAKERRFSIHKTGGKGGKRAQIKEIQKRSKSPPKIQPEKYEPDTSDIEIKSQPNKTNKSMQSRQHKSKFQYSSTSNAQQIYQNPPFSQLDVTQSMQASSAVQLQQQMQNARPMTTQYHQRGKSQNKIGKKGSALSTMGDVTTLGTTATGHITNLNNYQQLNLIGSQHQTIDQYGNYGQVQPGVMSMLQQYNDEGKIINGMGSQRRPTTASAAQSNNRSLVNFMKPVLQQRLESFDATSQNKIAKFNKVASHNQNYQQRTQGESSDLGNKSVIQKYFTQNPHLEISQTNINVQIANQNQVGGSNLIGPAFAPINLGPSRKTQKFINKMAPNLKENDMYPKFMTGARKSTSSNNSSAFHQQRLMSNDAISTQSHQAQVQKNRRLLEANRRSDLLNLSTNNFDKSLKEESVSNYEQTPQGVFPKFVKRQLTSQSNSSRKEIKQAVTANTQTNQPPKFVNQSMQTRIGNVSNKLLISPMSGTVDPFAHENMSEVSRQDSHKSDQDKFSRKHVKTPVVDWAYTPLFQRVIKDDIEFNRQFSCSNQYSAQDISYYVEKEVDYVIDMMKNKFKDFKRSDIMKPFFLKAQNTLRILMEEQNLLMIYDTMAKNYHEVTIENTMKLLIRCKLAFHQRSMLLDIMKSLISYELVAVELKHLIDKHQKYRIHLDDYNSLKSKGDQVFDNGHQVLVHIKSLRSVHKQFKVPFIFKKKVRVIKFILVQDYVNYVKSEMNEVKKLVSIFKISKSASQSQDLAQSMVELRKIEENKHETEEHSYYSTER